MRVAVLVSGSGTILDAILARGVPVSVVVADRRCGALARAERNGIAVELLERTDFSAAFDRDAYSTSVADVIAGHGIDLVAMAGWGTVFSSPMHEVFGGRILNTHPALLPAFPGWHAVRDALAYGVKVTGCTVHVAGLEVDTGRILAQRAVDVFDDDDETSLHERIKVVEREIYPSTIEAILDGRIVLEATGGVPASSRTTVPVRSDQ
ncbi:MAG: phosphoribosylglycinamide formyltransferase [Actinobacteria bacterium]|nr:phosphoribosylglycinamide formyltransferase [Actinomycetota bacterium]